MSNNRFVKFIIPCWRCEETISKMVDSILNQTCKDFFIVLVDDMSTDGTFKILKDYEAKYPNFIKAVQVPEKSFADGAREYGFHQYEDAEFTWFVDADDELFDNQVLEKLKAIHQEKQLDMYTVDCDRFKFNIKRQCHAPWFRIVRSTMVEFVVLHLPCINDVAQCYKQFDSIPDDRIYDTRICAIKYNGSHSAKNIAQIGKERFNENKRMLNALLPTLIKNKKYLLKFAHI